MLKIKSSAYLASATLVVLADLLFFGLIPEFVSTVICYPAVLFIRLAVSGHINHYQIFIAFLVQLLCFSLFLYYFSKLWSKFTPNK